MPGSKFSVTFHLTFFPVGGVSAFTSQSAGGVMATGSASSQQIGYSEQHVPADRRYILQNPGNVPVHDDRGVYMVPGMSG